MEKVNNGKNRKTRNKEKGGIKDKNEKTYLDLFITKLFHIATTNNDLSLGTFFYHKICTL